jgi:diguanylate cyclase (GGDEF)-like protein
MVQDVDRTELEALSTDHPQLAEFLANTPGVGLWLCDPDVEDCVSEARIRRVALGPDVYTVPALDLARVNAAIRTATGATDQILEATLRGEPHRLHVRTFAIRTEAGRRVVVAARDVTVEQKLEEALKRSNDTLRELNFSLGCTTAEAVHLALADPLTGLPNRRAFDAALEDACKHGDFALCLFDMDRFKDVNDSLGHATGDRLLVEVGEKLRQRVRGRDFIGRLAGDEFAVILHDVRSASTAQEAANRILSAFNGRLDLGDVDLQASMTAGVALGTEGDDPQAVFRHADMALHTAKAKRRGSLTVHANEPSNLAEHDDLVVVKAMLSHRRLPLLFEPLVRRDLSLAGHEIMVEVDGAAPRRFDDLFETATRFGLGEDLAEALFREAAHTTGSWRDGRPLHLRLPPRIVDVEGAADRLASHIANAELEPGSLVLEVPLAALTGVHGEELLESLSATGSSIALGDWDMSLAAFNLTATGRIQLAKIAADEAGSALFRDGVGAVWRAAFSSLAASGVAVCAVNVRSREAADRLFALGADMARGPALASTHPLPSRTRPRLVTAA